MSISPLESYIANIQSEKPTLPAILDRFTARQILSDIVGESLLDIDSIQTGDHPGLFVYDVPEGKKEFSITTVHTIKSDISLAPYEGKHLFLLRNFDRASHAAQNAMLKILEDYPDYAVILLLADAPNEIFETIHSRCVLFLQSGQQHALSPETESLLARYLHGDATPWLAYMYNKNFSPPEAIALLVYVFPYLSAAKQTRCIESIQSLYSTYESSRNILEAFFLDMN